MHGPDEAGPGVRVLSGLSAGAGQHLLDRLESGWRAMEHLVLQREQLDEPFLDPENLHELRRVPEY